ncbi:MAG: SLBB domain-containing protein, partial [Candidatus Poribacteria bacterium]
FVGPMDMANANIQATVPDRYTLGPGDKINITYWTDIVEPKTEILTVDEKGEVTTEKLGKMVVRGMTLAQFEEAVKAGLSRVAYKNLQLIATLDELRSIQIFITGEVFRPGSYAVSAVTTVANALYMCGGPNENGSLRDIKLIRRNETKSIDFYKFLMKGDSSQDYSLESGDTIMVPLVGKTVTISGEVKRPAIYELKADENLKELITIAGNIRPTGYIQRVRIDSVNPSRERIIIDVDMTNPEQTDNELFDGDIVTVFSIPAEKMNTVNIEGKIRMPGTYQLKEGMKISDLIRSAQGLLDEAYMERADLIRFNSDKKTTSLIPIDLSKVLSGTDDVTLSQWDKLIIYSKWDIKWIANRVVDVHGAIQRPGSYERSDGMKIYDLLIKCGGVLPNAYLDRALLFRRDNTNRITKSIPINLDLAIKKDENNNVDLYDGDILVVYTIQEARWEPKREVVISGAVQNPGNFIRTDGMKISDLLKSAGGVLPNAYLDKAFLLRLDERRRTTIGFFVNIKLAMQNDPNNNLELKDGDELIIAEILIFDEPTAV